MLLTYTLARSVILIESYTERSNNPKFYIPHILGWAPVKSISANQLHVFVYYSLKIGTKKAMCFLQLHIVSSEKHVREMYKYPLKA